MEDSRFGDVADTQEVRQEEACCILNNGSVLGTITGILEIYNPRAVRLEIHIGRVMSSNHVLKSHMGRVMSSNNF